MSDMKCGGGLGKNLFILSAPSATGKNTVYEAVKKRMPEVERAITATTRPPRSNEKHGVDYYYLTEAEFQEKKERGEFVEHNLYDNGYYATLCSELEKHPQTTPVFIILDINGRKNVVGRYPLATSIFLKPPSIEELRRRFSSRGENTPEEIENRINMALAEIEASKDYDYVIVNNDVDTVAKEIVDIVCGKELK